MSTTVRDRVGAAMGAAFVALIVAGNQLTSAGSVQSAHPTGEQVLQDVAHQSSSATVSVGFVLELLGFAAFIGFLGYLADVLGRTAGRRPGSIAAGAAVVSGAVMLAIKLGSGAPVGALSINHGDISPQLAQVLADMNGVAFVISWLPFAVFVAAAAVALHRAHLVGRPTAYSGLLLGAAGLVLSIFSLRNVFNLHDPNGANALAFLLGLAWLLAVSVRLAVKPGTRARSGEISGETANSRVAVSA